MIGIPCPPQCRHLLEFKFKVALEAEGDHSPIGVSRAVDPRCDGVSFVSRMLPAFIALGWIASHLEQQMDVVPHR